MKKTLQILAASVLLWQGVPGLSAEMEESQPEEAREFLFKFEPNQPLLYAMKMSMDMDMDLKTPDESAKIKMGLELRFKIKLTLKEKREGEVSKVKMEPSDLEGDWDISGPAGHIVMKLRGSDMTGTVNGVTTIDTKKGIGLTEARQVKNEVAALYLSGEMDMDSRGNVVKFYGDVPFVEFWTEASEGQLGLFGIVFPDKPVAAGETWQEALVLKKIGEISFEEPGLRCTVKVTRQPDVIVAGRRINQFAISAPFEQKNLAGHMTQMGQQVKVNILSFDRKASGTVRFDAEKGVVIDCPTKIDATANMEMTIGAEKATADLVIKAEADVQLAKD